MAWTSNVKSLIADPTQEAWAAFAIALIYEVNPDEAFDVLSGDLNPNEKKKRTYTDEELEDIYKLKEYCTWAEIGEIFGVTWVAVQRYAHRMRDKKRGVTK